MTSPARRYQDSRYQQDDDARRWRDERDDDSRRHQGSDREFREVSGYGRGRENYPQREGRWQDEYGGQNEFSGNRSGGYNRGRFEEGYFGERGELWDRAPGGWDRYQGGGRLRESDLYRSHGPYERGQRGLDHDDQDRAQRGYFGGEPQSSWDRGGGEIPSWGQGEEAGYRLRQDQGRQDWNRDERARYQGVGPKNYRRSDERIREDVSDRLTDNPYVNAAEIEVAVSGSEATLSGLVENRGQRRLAELIAEHVSGVSHVQNNLRVKNLAQGSIQGWGQGLSAGQGAGAASQSASGTAKAGSHA